MTGILNPVVGALVHNLGSVFVILNSAKLLKTRNNLALNCNVKLNLYLQMKAKVL